MQQHQDSQCPDSQQETDKCATPAAVHQDQHPALATTPLQPELPAGSGVAVVCDNSPDYYMLTQHMVDVPSLPHHLHVQPHYSATAAAADDDDGGVSQAVSSELPRSLAG